MKESEIVLNRLNNQITHIQNKKGASEHAISKHKSIVEECRHQLNWLWGFKHQWEEARKEEKA